MFGYSDVNDQGFPVNDRVENPTNIQDKGLLTLIEEISRSVYTYDNPNGADPDAATNQDDEELIGGPINFGLNKLKTYKNFSHRVKQSKKKLINLLKKLKNKNKKIISYGATYKSTTVFNYCKIGLDYFHYVTDTTKNKQGKFTPGMHIPILPPEIGFNESVDIAFLGAWNFKKEIFNKEKKFIKKGGKFIVHVPSPKII